MTIDQSGNITVVPVSCIDISQISPVVIDLISLEENTVALAELDAIMNPPATSTWEKAAEYLGCLAGMDPSYVGPTTTASSPPTQILSIQPRKRTAKEAHPLLRMRQPKPLVLVNAW